MIEYFEAFASNKKRCYKMQLKHPERRKGEVFYCNVNDKKQFDTMKFKTKRMGEIAYSLSGKKIKPLVEGGGPFPVFVQKSELDRKAM